MNRLTCIGASDDLAYDSDGNLLTREVGVNHWDYSYDVFNRLITVKYNDSVQRRYQSDAYGRRVRSFNGASNNFKYVYSGLNVVYEVPNGGGSGTLRFYAGGQQVAEKVGATVTYLHQDHLGSTRLKTDSSGNKVFSSNYQPFGVDSGISGSEEFRYTGKPSDDATGLYYFGARYYDPSLGRFITEDPHSWSLSDPQSLNRYVYCRNNPHKYTDPNGHAWWLVFGAINLIANVTIYCATHSEWDLREIAVTGTVGFISGAIGGGVAGNAIIQALGPVVKVAVSTITTLMISAPSAVATELVLDSAMQLEQKKPREVIEDITIGSAYSAGMSAASTVLPSIANVVVDPREKEIIKTAFEKIVLAIAKEIGKGSFTYTTREDFWWDDPIYNSEDHSNYN